MKRLNLLSGILMAIAMTLSFSACSDNNDPAPTPDPDPQPELSDYHFDIFMTIGKHGGMNQGDGTIVKSVNSLTADMEVIDIKNDGVEFRSENNTYSTWKPLSKGNTIIKCQTQTTDLLNCR